MGTAESCGCGLSLWCDTRMSKVKPKQITTYLVEVKVNSLGEIQA